MDNTIGKNIYMLRKKQGLTQEELARLVNVSFQAISKWETGNSTPDISALPLLANVFHCSIDSLLGYPAEQQKIMDYEERYKAFRQICSISGSTVSLTLFFVQALFTIYRWNLEKRFWKITKTIPLSAAFMP